MSAGGEPVVQRLTRFFSEERRSLLAHLRRTTRALDTMDAEDVISEVALHLFERPDLVGRVENLAAYVYRALERRVVDWMRERKRKLLELDMDEGFVDGRSEGATVERALLHLEVRTRLFEALARLPAPQRAIWIETEIEGRTFREVAERSGEPIGTLLARKHRATAALRVALREMGLEDPRERKGLA